MGNTASNENGGGGRAYSATHSAMNNGRVTGQVMHRRTLSSSSGRLARFNPFNSSRGSSSVDLTLRPDAAITTTTTTMTDMSMRSSSGSRLPPAPNQRSLFSARKMLRRQSDVPLPTSTSPNMQDGLRRVSEVIHEDGTMDDGGAITRSSTSPRDNMDYPTGIVRQERSHSEGTGIVTISTKRTASEREEELIMLHRIRKFTPLIPDQPSNYFSFGNWLMTAAGGNNRYNESDTAVDGQALTGAFLAYQLHQRALCETICERQRNIVTSIKSLNEYTARSERRANYQCRETQGTAVMLTKEVASLESQVLKTRELIHDIMQTLIKLNDIMGNNHELSLTSKPMQSQYPALSRAYRHAVSNKHPGAINIEKKRLSIQHRRWDRSSVLLTVNPVLAEGSHGMASSTNVSNVEAQHSLSPQPSGEISIMTGPSMSTARLRQFVHQDGVANNLTRDIAVAATASSSSLPGALESNWVLPLRSPSFWARSITRRPIDMDDVTSPTSSSFDLRRQDSVLSENSVDFDTMLQMGCRRTLPDSPTPKRSAPLLSMMTSSILSPPVPSPIPPSEPELISSRLTIQQQQQQQQHEARLTRSLNGPPSTGRSSRDRLVPYDVVNERNSIKRQRARLKNSNSDQDIMDEAMFEGIIRKLSITSDSNNEEGSINKHTPHHHNKSNSNLSHTSLYSEHSNTTDLHQSADTTKEISHTNELEASTMMMTTPMTPISRPRGKGKIRQSLLTFMNGPSSPS